MATILQAWDVFTKYWALMIKTKARFFVNGCLSQFKLISLSIKGRIYWYYFNLDNLICPQMRFLRCFCCITTLHCNTTMKYCKQTKKYCKFTWFYCILAKEFCKSAKYFCKLNLKKLSQQNGSVSLQRSFLSLQNIFAILQKSSVSQQNCDVN